MNKYPIVGEKMQKANQLPLWMLIAASARERIKWFGTAFFFVGSAVISLSTELSIAYWPYALFAVGHILWTISGFLMRDRAVVALNVMYLPFDFIAIFMRV